MKSVSVKVFPRKMVISEKSVKVLPRKMVISEKSVKVFPRKMVISECYGVPQKDCNI